MTRSINFVPTQNPEAEATGGLSRRTALLSLAAVPLLGGALAACGSSDGADDADAPTASDQGGDAPAGEGLTMEDPWVKAAEEGMTAAFGILHNGTDKELTLVAVSTEASPDVELHETTSDGSGGMSMKEKEGGFPIAPGESLTLEPGAEHIMLMDLAEPLKPGDEVTMTLEFEEGETLEVTATVKQFTGAQEHYENEDGAGASDGGGDMGGMDHSGHGSDDEEADHQ